MRAGGGESGRRYSQRTAAAASEASPKWPPPSRPPPPTPPPPTAHYRYRRRGPSSREKQQRLPATERFYSLRNLLLELHCGCQLGGLVSSGAWASGFIWQSTYVDLLHFTQGLLFSLLSCDRLGTTPWTAGRPVSSPFAISQNLLKLMFIESVMGSNHLILSVFPLIPLPSIFPRM
nr:LOW QUALITY PROTEIN: uncharacterized protein LOC110142428 [Odocoileus virginianus texanus]